MPKTCRDVSKEHRSPLDGTPTSQIGGDLSSKRNNDNSYCNPLSKKKIIIHESILIFKRVRETPFCTEECQVTSVEGMILLEKSLLCKHHCTESGQDQQWTLKSLNEMM